jgi:hypothetical protein
MRRLRKMRQIIGLLLCIFFTLVADSASEGQEYKLVTSWPEEILGLRYPSGIAVDDSGNVYVADSGSCRTQKFDSDDNFLTKWGTHGSGDGQFSGTIGVAVDDSGKVYVADTDKSRIQKFDSEGNFLTKWRPSGFDDGELFIWRYCDVAVDVSGNVYIADYANNRIRKFRPADMYVVESVDKLATSWSKIKASGLLSSFALKQNYPNPLNPETWIPYSLAEDSEVTIRIYSATGQLIRLLNLGYKQAGSYLTKDTAAYWDGRSDTGEHVSSDVYFCNIQAGKYSATRKMTVVR